MHALVWRISILDASRITRLFGLTHFVWMWDGRSLEIWRQSVWWTTLAGWSGRCRIRLTASTRVCLGQNDKVVGAGHVMSTPQILADLHYWLFDTDVDHLVRLLTFPPIPKNVFARFPCLKTIKMISGRDYLEKWESHAELVRVVPGTVLFPHTRSLISWIMWQLPPNDWMRIKGMGEVTIQQRLLSKTQSWNRVSGRSRNIPIATNVQPQNRYPCRLEERKPPPHLTRSRF